MTAKTIRKILVLLDGSPRSCNNYHKNRVVCLEHLPSITLSPASYPDMVIIQSKLGRLFCIVFGRHLVDTRVCRIFEGTEEILKLKITAGVLVRVQSM